MEQRARELLTPCRSASPASGSRSPRSPAASARSSPSPASLIGEPKVVILDEPTAALGVEQTAQVLDLVERLRERGLGVILISHNMADVKAVADKVAVLRLGRNNGVFDVKDTSHEEIISAITGATDNAVTRRAGAQRGGAEVSTRQDVRRPVEDRRPRCRRRRGAAAAAPSPPSTPGCSSARRASRATSPSSSASCKRRRPGLAAGHHRPDHHLDRLPAHEQRASSAPSNLANIAVVMVGHRHDRRRHRLRAAARRDRPVGRLGQRSGRPPSSPCSASRTA